MIKADVHVHSSFSTDSETAMENQVKAAIAAGVNVLCFTDHIDYDYPESGTVYDFNVAEYQREIERLREIYRKKIEILMGVELGMQKHLGGCYKKLLDDYPFDFSIGSQHLVGGHDPFFSAVFEGRTDREVYREYFEDLLEDVRLFHSFDCLGHLDYVVRYGRHRAREYSYRAYADIIDEILKLLIRYNIAIEINTAGLRKMIGFPNPHPLVLKRYREMGGTLVTIGSDAHKTAHVSCQFDEAVNILRNCGFTHYAYYVKRKPKFVKI
jgi:histidinol-phosphatase (PHP family)